MGHYVRIGTKHGDHKWYEWEGFEVFDGTDTLWVNQMLQDEGFDYIFTQWDIWLMAGKRMYPKQKWVAYIPVDTEWISEKLVNVSQNAGMHIAMSRHGLRELTAAGFSDALYAPHGFDDKVFSIQPEGRARFRGTLNLTDENFVIGSVGLNYGDDRKGFIPLMRAFKKFHGRHPEARLYLHTLANDRNTVDSAINLYRIACNLEIQRLTYWPDQSSYHLNRLTVEDMRDAYNGMDVFCLPTRGEGFGLPIIEAQACGQPVIVSNSTTGPELCKSGWLIDVGEDNLQWLSNDTWRYEPVMSNILAQLENAHAAWKAGQIDRAAVRAKIMDYTWDNVWQKYWIPILQAMERRLHETT